MIVCRTSQPEKLRKNFIKAKPLAVVKWVTTILALTAAMTYIIITETIPRELSGWIFLLAMSGFLTFMFTSISRTENKFNSFIIENNDNIIFLNLGNVFMNSRLFGEELNFSHSKIRLFIEWAKASNRMSEYSDGTELDKFITNDAVLGGGYYIKQILSIKNNSNCIIAKLRLKKCQTVKGELFTEYTKKVRIPKNYENASILEKRLISGFGTDLSKAH